MSIKQYPGGIITKNPTAPTTSAAKGIWTLDQAQNYTKQGIWPRSPGAPTIGTATATSSTTATVTYTAPTDLGTGSITYTATSSPGGLTGTGASPITVTGLTGGTSYTFTVTATTPGGTGPASAASNSITTSYAIGQALGGGFFAGQISTAGNGIADYNLVVANKAAGEVYGKAWGPDGITTGVTSVIAGPTNSATLAALGATYEAATFCEGLTTGGYSDWYLPAKNELEVCYFFLKPGTQQNSTSYGSNANAVSPEPISTNYTNSGGAPLSPTQTSATNFRTGASGEEFGVTDGYWTSTEVNSTKAFLQIFSNGTVSNTDYKLTFSMNTRAVRRVAV